MLFIKAYHLDKISRLNFIIGYIKEFGDDKIGFEVSIGKSI